MASISGEWCLYILMLFLLHGTDIVSGLYCTDGISEGSHCKSDELCCPKNISECCPISEIFHVRPKGLYCTDGKGNGSYCEPDELCCAKNITECCPIFDDMFKIEGLGKELAENAVKKLFEDEKLQENNNRNYGRRGFPILGVIGLLIGGIYRLYIYCSRKTSSDEDDPRPLPVTYVEGYPQNLSTSAWPNDNSSMAFENQTYSLNMPQEANPSMPLENQPQNLVTPPLLGTFEKQSNEHIVPQVQNPSALTPVPFENQPHHLTHL